MEERNVARVTARLLVLALAVGALLGFAAAASAAAPGPTVWLCRPGAVGDPCTPGLSTTTYSPTLQPLGTSTPVATTGSRRPACFYVYPTVSDQKTPLANLTIDPEERSIALYQAARYSQYCDVWAPMYRQVTLTALFSTGTETPHQLEIGYRDVRNAFVRFLRLIGPRRGFVLIGHSQGAFVLRKLIANEIDRVPKVRRRMLSAILMGGNVLVRRGRDVGGDFKHIRACHSGRQLHCVIAFSTFDQPVPANSKFGISTTPGRQVLCVNPASLGGGSGKLDPIFPAAPFAPNTLIAAGIGGLQLRQPTPATVWIELPGAYTGACETSGRAHVLEIRPVGGAQLPTPSPDATWGLHLLDAQIALGNLLSIVHSESLAYRPRSRSACPPLPRTRARSHGHGAIVCPLAHPRHAPRLAG